MEHSIGESWTDEDPKQCVRSKGGTVTQERNRMTASEAAQCGIVGREEREMAKDSKRRIFRVVFAGLMLCLFAVSDAAAKDRKWKMPKGGGQLTVVEAVDVANRTLTAGGVVYFVPQNASLEDAGGDRISLSQINGVGSNTSADLVEIWTRKRGRDSQPEIKRLKVNPAMSF